MEARSDLPLIGNYVLNTDNHLRIWFSANENVFLNSENQLRLVRLRANNPTDSILFIYDKRLLSDSAKLELQRFCQQHTIQTIDLEDLKPDLANDQERELMSYVEEEIRRAKDNTGGNLAAASDILRLLSPIYKTGGIYSDFDIKIVTSGLPSKMTVEAPIILNLGSYLMPVTTGDKVEEFEHTTICNDILAIPKPNPASPEFTRLQDEQNQKICLLQREILQNYQQSNINFKEVRYKYPNSLDLFTMIGGNQDELKEIDGQDIFEVRRKLQYIFSTNANFIIFSLMGLFAADPLAARLFVDKFNCTFEEAIKGKLDEKTLQDFYFGQLQKTMRLVGASLPDLPEDQLLDLMRLKSETAFYKITVMNISGPLVLKSLLDSWAPNIQEYRAYSWEHYKLDDHFKSGQQIKFATSLEKLIAASQTKDMRCDISWIREGQAAIKERERLMNSSAALIQMRYREHLQKKAAKQAGSEKELAYRARRMA